MNNYRHFSSAYGIMVVSGYIVSFKIVYLSNYGRSSSNSSKKFGMLNQVITP